MTEDEITAIEANLFTHVRDLVRGEPAFPWHRDKAKAVTASQIVSSQALAVDFFGTINRLASRDQIVSDWVRHWDLNLGKTWEIELESKVPKDLLGEPTSTQIDALARGPSGLIAFECKFTERDGGSCSQPIPLSAGKNEGRRQCNGNYEDQPNPVNGTRSQCSLTGKGVRYWELVPEVMNIDPNRDHTPCPFSGGWYQWMRNLVAALALGSKYHVPAAFVVVYVDGPFPMAQKIRSADWARLVAAVDGRSVPLRTASYQQLLASARAAAQPRDLRVIEELAVWMTHKQETAAEQLSRGTRAVFGEPA